MFANIQVAGDECTDLVRETRAGGISRVYYKGINEGRWPGGSLLCLNPASQSESDLLWLRSPHPLSGGLRLYWAHPDVVGYSCYSLLSGARSTGGWQPLCQSHNGSPLASKTASERKHRMKSRVSEGLHQTTASHSGLDLYNQHRMVRGSGCAWKITHFCSFHGQYTEVEEVGSREITGGAEPRRMFW